MVVNGAEASNILARKAKSNNEWVVQPAGSAGRLLVWPLYSRWEILWEVTQQAGDSRATGVPPARSQSHSAQMRQAGQVWRWWPSPSKSPDQKATSWWGGRSDVNLGSQSTEQGSDPWVGNRSIVTRLG